MKGMRGKCEGRASDGGERRVFKTQSRASFRSLHCHVSSRPDNHFPSLPAPPPCNPTTPVPLFLHHRPVLTFFCSHHLKARPSFLPFYPSLLPSLLTSYLSFIHPSLLHSFLSSFLSFLSSTLTFFLFSFLSYLISFLPSSFPPSFPFIFPSIHASLLPSLLTSYL